MEGNVVYLSRIIRSPGFEIYINITSIYSSATNNSELCSRLILSNPRRCQNSLEQLEASKSNKEHSISIEREESMQRGSYFKTERDNLRTSRE